MKNNNFVIDASFLVSMVLLEKDYELVKDFFREKALNPSINFIVPYVFLHETMNSTLRGIRDGRIKEDDQIEEIKNFINDCDVYEEVHTNMLIRFVKKYLISFYDANYLDLALEHSAILCTFDKQLITAAKAEGVQLWEPGFSSVLH